MSKLPRASSRPKAASAPISALTEAESALSFVVAATHCLLWQADVVDTGAELLWDLKFLDEETAQHFLPLAAPPGWSYLARFQSSWHPDDTERMHRLSTESIRSGRSGYQQEYRVRTATGELRWLAETVSIKPVGDRRWRVIGVCTDLTDSKKAQAEMSQVLKNARCLLWQADVVDNAGLLEWDCVYSNQEAAQEFMPLLIPAGWSYTRAFDACIIREDDRPMFGTYTSEMPEGKGGYQQEFRIRLASGEVRWIEENVTIEPVAPGRWRLTGVSTDITQRRQAQEELQRGQAELESRFHDRTTELRLANLALQGEIAERKLAQEKLRESEAEYRAIVEDQTEMIARFLQDGTITFVNEAHCRYFGVSSEDAVGKSFLNRLPTEEAARVRVHLASLGQQNPVGVHELSSPAANGALRWQRWTDHYISNPEGEFVCFQSVGQDVTVRKQAEEALLLAKEEAERANLAKSVFLSQMSHELRTPLNAILGFGQILDRSNLRPQDAESVHHILKGGRHLLELINEILDLARVEAGRTDVSIESVSVGEVVQESLDVVRSLAPEHGVSLIADIEAIAPYHALADRQRLKQVLINLFSNAIKYNVPGGSVQVTCVQAHDRLRIDVVDTGLGIPPKDIDKLFTPFERLGAGDTGVEGTGLGLALSRRLVLLMGGALEVESVVGVGSTFTVSLPVGEYPSTVPGAAGITLPDQATTTVPDRSHSVLCIEDNPSNLRLLEVILASRPGVEMFAAIQGRIGLDLARRLLPDLILLDLNLPDINGAQVLAELRQSKATSGIPVAVVSADATPLRIERLLSQGADAFLTKPLDVAEVLSTLDRFLT